MLDYIIESLVNYFEMIDRKDDDFLSTDKIMLSIKDKDGKFKTIDFNFILSCGTEEEKEFWKNKNYTHWLIYEDNSYDKLFERYMNYKNHLDDKLKAHYIKKLNNFKEENDELNFYVTFNPMAKFEDVKDKFIIDVLSGLENQLIKDVNMAEWRMCI